MAVSPGLGPLFELGLPVFVGDRKELEPIVAERPLWIACLVSSIFMYPVECGC